MSERSLAHIERIIKIESIENADNIEKVFILGWQCICKKGIFKEGELCAYLEIDSVVPKIAAFEFMQERKYRIKTIKLRKTISQGLVLSLDEINNILKELKYIKNINFTEGLDITKELQIEKYQSPSEIESDNFTSKKKHHWIIKYFSRFQWFRKLFKMRSKSFPEFIPKTDECRIQNFPWMIEKHKDDEVYISEKIDGSSGTFWIRKTKFFRNEFGICSRNVRKSELDSSDWTKVAKQFNLKQKLLNISKQYKIDIAVQGEVISPSIQAGKYHNNKNRSKLIDFPLDFYVFNFYDITNKKYIDYNIMQFLCTEHNFKFVPILYQGLLKDYSTSLEDILLKVEGKSLLADTEREGFVVRTIDQQVSFKVISNKFLLKTNS